MACSARTADSRPAPGPRTRTSTSFSPCPIAWRRGILRDHLRRIGGALARALEANFAGARPADHVAVQIGDRDDRVVKSGKNVRDTGVNILAPLRLDDLRLLDVVRVERKVFLRRLGRGSFRFLGGFLRGLGLRFRLGRLGAASSDAGASAVAAAAAVCLSRGSFGHRRRGLLLGNTLFCFGRFRSGRFLWSLVFGFFGHGSVR